MMLTSLLTLSFLLPLALSSPLAPRQTSTSPPSAFGLIAARSASPIHLQAVNASSQAFWIGKGTSTYCPLNPQSACPPGNETVLIGGASLDVEVPGGQQVYVAPSGALGFTQAHSISSPPGSAFGPFNLTPAGGQFYEFTFTGLGATGFLACPADREGHGPWQVFANVKGLKDKDVPAGCKRECLGFDAVAVPYEGGPAAWQYV